ncbi:GH32 C-terminal domain-containing protein [Paenibacillus sp. N4]|uniref:GH32 C-terminal domain-containing protein n=1 Tax=Paenibacillus vietnamensis TaxID=2590547 RepID=UPI001CD068E4|nr:GH32 C-terminal domain-containing protein [Paenibacillus vietnamensis]MCA0755984.1 GH32 C-terminal domain-containing protein [Paenibacillus vietnamensis]
MQSKAFKWAMAFILLFSLCYQAIPLRTASAAETGQPEEERLRPLFHYTPERNWLNDPNGLVYYNGEYHIFYQYKPSGDTWGEMFWGHAVSRDLVNWEELPIALYPDELGHMFSGSVVVDWNNTSGFGANGQPPMVAMFTQEYANGQVQSLAYSNDSGRSWTVYDGNPVIPQPAGLSVFRDPKVIWHEQTNRWVMVVTAGDHVGIYSSPDLKAWTHESDFGAGQGSHNGVWETPDLFPLAVDGDPDNVKWVMSVSLGEGAPAFGSGMQYFIGDFDGSKFTNLNAPEKVLWTDFGADFYAGMTFSDTENRRIWLGWMNNWLYAQSIPSAGWRGAMTVPRELTLTAEDDGGIRLKQAPVEELNRLRQQPLELGAIPKAEGTVELPLAGEAYEIVAEFAADTATASSFGFNVHAGGSRKTAVGYDAAEGKLFVDRTRSGNIGFNAKFGEARHEAEYTAGGTLKLHLLVDKTSVELFADDGSAVFTDLLFPEEGSNKLELFAEGGAADLVSLNVYPLQAAEIGKSTDKPLSPHDIPNPDFESGDLTGWTAEGEAFTNENVVTDTDWGWGCCFNKQGVYHVWGAKTGDVPTGTLSSAPFVLGGSGDISFLIGGGNDIEKLYVALVRAEDDTELMKIANNEWKDDGTLRRVHMNAEDYLGETVYMKVVDNHTGGWGHISVDDFRVLNEPESIVNPGFETGDLTGWSTIGTAFAAPVSDVATYWGSTPFNHQGIYHAWGFAGAANPDFSDRRTGELRSSVFRLGGNGKISFRVGGGEDLNKLYVALVREADGEILFKATGAAPTMGEGYRRVEWDASEYLGESLSIRVVDYHTGGFGHINVDDFSVFNTEPVVPRELANPGFETGDLTGWTAEGDAFAGAVTDRSSFGDEEAPFSHAGNFHLWGLAGAADGTDADARTGTLASETFVLTGTGEIRFLIGGGQDEGKLYAALVRASDDAVLMKATGSGSETYTSVAWDATGYLGEKLYVKLADASAEGHLNIDDVQVRGKGLIGSWSLNEGEGKVALDEARGVEDDIHYVFNEAKYKPSTEPLWKDGIAGKGLLFDGYSTWIERPADRIAKPDDELTIEAWVAPRSYEWGDMGQLSAIVNQHDKAGKTGYILGMGRHGKWSLQAGINGGWAEVWADADKPLEKFKWSYVAATYSKTDGKLKLYLNGELAGEQTASRKTAIAPSDGSFLIGKNNTGAVINGVFTANMFNGLIDEVKVRSTALSAEEIAANYSAAAGVFENGEAPEPELDFERSVYDGDRYRPQYHFISPGHWMNEPHGPLYFEGKYHLFYQHNPQGPYWHQIHWGHAVSDDMVHWKDMPVALAPDGGSVTPDGVWSGNAVVDDNGNPALFFTAGNDQSAPNQNTGLARSTFLEDGDVNLKKWIMEDEVVTKQAPNLPAEEGEVWFGQFRDPYVWKDGDMWYQLVGSGIKNVGGTALLYSSPDMVHWTYENPFFTGDYANRPETGQVWELPVLLPVGKDEDGTQKYAFFINPWFDHYNEHNVKYVFHWIGTWDKETNRFIPDHEEPRLFDFGEHFTGPSGMVDGQGRSILFSIAQDRRTEQQHYDAGWAHNAGLPLVLSLRDDGTLGIEPIEELNSLRGEVLASAENASVAQANSKLKPVRGDMLEILLEADLAEADELGIKVRSTGDGREETLIYYDKENGRLEIDRSRSSLDPDIAKGIQGGEMALDDGKLKLRIYLDRSMVEAYADGKNSITSRVYPTQQDALGLELWSRGGEAKIGKLQVWEMNSAYGETAEAYWPAAAPAAEKLVGLANHDFESGDLSGWIVEEGNAFTDAHVTARNDWGWGGPFNQAYDRQDEGRHHLWGFHPDYGDDAVGRMKSGTFTLGGDGAIDFLIAGGRDIDKLYVALVRASDGEVLMKATGHDSEQYRRVKWDASAYKGEKLYIQIVDQRIGGWGHLNVDDVNVPAAIQPETGGGENPPAGGGNAGGQHPQTEPGKITIDVGKVTTEKAADGRSFAKAQLAEGLIVRGLAGAAASEAKRLVIEWPALGEDGIDAALPIEPLKEAAQSHPELVVTLVHGPVSYDVPLKLLLQAESADGADRLHIVLESPAEDTVKAMEEAAKQAGLSLLSKPYEFKLLLGADGELEELTDFGSRYVTRSITVAGGLDPSKATALLFDPATGSYRFVPAVFEAKGDETVAVLKRNGNSLYVLAKAEKTFRDLPGHWASNDIEQLASKQIVRGASEDAFLPNAAVTRAEFAALLVRGLGLTAGPDKPESFNDVHAQDWYEEAVGTAAGFGLVQGYGDGSFKPRQLVSREEMAVMIARALHFAEEGSQEGTGSDKEKLDAYADGKEVSSWAREALSELLGRGLLLGRSSGLLDPRGSASRAEAASMLKRHLTSVGFINE